MMLRLFSITSVRGARNGSPLSSGLFYFPVVVLLVGLFLATAGCGGSSESIDPASLRGGETRPTLSPAYFTGKAAQAYTAAREIPEVLDSLHCYCECKKNYGHKSLLTCYTDRHALHCSVCIEEALMAHRMHKDGKDVVAIRRAVDKKFSK